MNMSQMKKKTALTHNRKRLTLLDVTVPAAANYNVDTSRHPVWTETMRAYLKQQIAQAGTAEERADAIRLAQKLARA